jgi:ADP-heptose:LPS heptosyltransferase
LTSQAQQVLVYRLGSLGDTCIALPALRVVRWAFPQARITLLTNLPVNFKAAPAPALLEGLGIVDDYLAYPVGTRNLITLARLGWRLRRRSFGAVVNLTAWRGAGPLQRDARFFRLCRIRKQVGFDPNGGHELRSLANGETEREAARLLRRVVTLGQAELHDRRWFDLDLTAVELADAHERLAGTHFTGDYIVLSIGTKISVNDWGHENWRLLVKALGRTGRKLGCVFIGSADEAARAEESLQSWSGPRLNLCGHLAPRTSAAILSGALVFVGHDSGPMHLAAAVGTRCVAIFSARNPPGQWFPLGTGHQVLYRRVSCAACGLDNCTTEQKRCIRGITVDEVVAAVTQQIEGAQGRRHSASDQGARQPIPPDEVL